MAEARNVVLVHGGFGKNSRFDTLATRTVALAFALAFVVGACDAYAQGGGDGSGGDLTLSIAAPADGAEVSVPFGMTIETDVSLRPPEVEEPSSPFRTSTAAPTQPTTIWLTATRSRSAVSWRQASTRSPCRSAIPTIATLARRRPSRSSSRAVAGMMRRAPSPPPRPRAMGTDLDVPITMERYRRSTRRYHAAVDAASPRDRLVAGRPRGNSVATRPGHRRTGRRAARLVRLGAAAGGRPCSAVRAARCRDVRAQDDSRRPR